MEDGARLKLLKSKNNYKNILESDLNIGRKFNKVPSDKLYYETKFIKLCKPR